MTNNTEVRAMRFDVRKISDDGTFKGYGSVFGVEDTYGTQFEPGAFKDSLDAHKRDGTMPALLWQHDSAQPIGVWTVLREDENGLWCEGKLLPDVARGKEALTLLREGAITGLSIGFRVVVDEWDRDNEVVRIKQVDLWEVSVVTFPANHAARVDEVKSAGELSDLRAALRQRDLVLRGA